ncbi:MAG: hypothetical protein ABH845_06585 [Candidatus Omnitrophota bacterium]
MKRRFLWILVGVLFLIHLFWLQANMNVRADEGDLTKQIAQILKNQEKMMGQLDAIQQQLQVIRVRVN